MTRPNSLIGADPTLTESASLSGRAKRVMPAGNARSTVFRKPFPIYLERGDGADVVDVDGNRYIDFDNNFTSLIHGHSHPSIVKALRSQSERGTSFGAPTRSEIVLAELLCERVPYFDHVRFMSTGTEAVMNAVKAARALTGRRLIAKCEGAYHGSFDPVEVSLDSAPDNWGSANSPANVPFCSATPDGLVRDTIVIPFNDLNAASAILNGVKDDLAGVLIDPMPSKVGLVPIEPDYLGFLREFTERNHSLLIADEVLNFRLSYTGGLSRFGVEPDLCAFGKIIGGGMPVGAVAGRRHVMALFDPSSGKPPVPQAGTFSANPMTMVAGFAAMQALTPMEFSALDELGAYTRALLQEMIAEEGLAFSVTGLGSLLRLHPHASPPANYRESYQPPDKRKLMTDISQLALKGGVMLPPTGLICLSTPMTKEQVDQLAATLRECLVTLAAH